MGTGPDKHSGGQHRKLHRADVQVCYIPSCMCTSCWWICIVSSWYPWSATSPLYGWITARTWATRHHHFTVISVLIHGQKLDNTQVGMFPKFDMLILLTCRISCSYPKPHGNMIIWDERSSKILCYNMIQHSLSLLMRQLLTPKIWTEILGGHILGKRLRWFLLTYLPSIHLWLTWLHEPLSQYQQCHSSG